MKLEKLIYQDFKDAVNRIDNIDNLQIIAEEYIYDEIPPSNLTYILDANLLIPPFTEKILRNEAVLIQTAKILALMEASDNKKEFEKLFKKRKKTKDVEENDIEGFDKILKGIMKVPKPKDVKKPSD